MNRKEMSDPEAVMPEEEMGIGSVQQLASNDQENGVARSEHPVADRRATLGWIVRVGAAGAVGAVLFYVWLFYQSGAWQMLAVAACEAVAGLLLIQVVRLSRRGSFDAAGYWILATAMLAIGGPELFHAGVTLYLAPGGILLICVVGILGLPHKRLIWLIAVALYAAYFGLVNWLQPVPRYALGQLGASTDAFAVALVAFLAAAGMWGIARAYRRVMAIRTRLTISFVLVVLLPVAVIAATLSLVGLRTARQLATDRLVPVTILKEAEIEHWLADLKIDLDLVLADQVVVTHLTTLDQEPPDSGSYGLAKAALQERLAQVFQRTGRYDELFLMGTDGIVLVSTDASKEGDVRNNKMYFREGIKEMYVQPPYYSSSDMQAFLFVSRPFQDDQGQILGVLAGRASLDSLEGLVAEHAGLGETGETYLVGENHTLLTPTRYGDINVWESTPGIDAAADRKVNGSGLYKNYRSESVVGAYRWLPGLQVALIVEQSQTEALRPIFLTLGLIATAALLGIVIAVLVSVRATRGIARPLINLTETAARVAAGDLGLMARVEREDELGALAGAFNTMTGRVRQLVSGLEQRVAERTEELERRSAYMEASAEVGRAASSVLDPEQLVRQLVDLIRERFDLYYVGLFMVDQAREWAVLQAGTGEAGQVMLARGHRIRVGEGMIGWTVANNRWRVALEAAEDEVRLVMPELPDTRSEAALPLRSRGRVLGALTVQDARPGAFDEDTIVVLQIMADQVAVALDNARLFAESQAALEAERRAYGEISREAWLQMVHARPQWGYRCDNRGVSAVATQVDPDLIRATKAGPAVRESDGAGSSVAVPIPLRDQVLGVLNFRKSAEGESWTTEEVAFLRDMAEQLGQALESARLYQDTQRRAAREQAIRHVTERMRRAVDIETILQSTVTELASALGVPRAYVRLGTELDLKPGDGQGRQSAGQSGSTSQGDQLRGDAT
jgi:GAF domain-containing protein/HAMP domain-containing protein